MSFIPLGAHHFRLSRKWYIAPVCDLNDIIEAIHLSLEPNSYTDENFQKKHTESNHG